MSTVDGQVSVGPRAGRGKCPTAMVAVVLNLMFGAPAQALDATTSLARYPLETWTENKGLSSSYINAIAQDRDGYLLLGTSAGLIRFDGLNFVRWEPARGPGLPMLGVNALLTARDGSLWIGFSTIGKVSRVRDGNVTNYGP